MSQYVAAIDQGTTSTRCIVFDHDGAVVSAGQKEHRQILPRAGWVEHDAGEIWANTREVVGQALARGDIATSDVVAVGITNQRETVVVWDRNTGRPVHNAIVWQDTRTAGICDELGALGGGSAGEAVRGGEIALPVLGRVELYRRGAHGLGRQLAGGASVVRRTACPRSPASVTALS